MTRRTRLLVVISVILTLPFLAGCGGSGKSPSTDVSVPVVTTTLAPRTVTYAMPSSSMEPTILCGRGPSAVGCTGVADDHVLVEEPAPQIHRSDIVVFNAPPEAALRCGKGGKLIKRVIGLPGETVHQDDHGYVWIKRPGSSTFVKLKEPYISAQDRLADRAHFGITRHVPPGEYFMMGDNRSESCDSRTFGPVPLGNVLGKVVKIDRPQY
jgi:signal peptidase I